MKQLQQELISSLSTAEELQHGAVASHQRCVGPGENVVAVVITGKMPLEPTSGSVQQRLDRTCKL